MKHAGESEKNSKVGDRDDEPSQGGFLRSPWAAIGLALILGASYVGGQGGGAGFIVGSTIGVAIILYLPIRLAQRFLPKAGNSEPKGFAGMLARLWLVVCVLPALAFGAAGAAFLGDSHTPGEVALGVMILGPVACLAIYRLGLWIVRGGGR